MSETVPISECPDPSVHGRPFRYCPYCEWREEPAPKTSITIPWPPSDELRNSLAVQLSHDLPLVVMGDCYDAVCNLLDAIGAGDE